MRSYQCCRTRSGRRTVSAADRPRVESRQSFATMSMITVEDPRTGEKALIRDYASYSADMARSRASTATARQPSCAGSSNAGGGIAIQQQCTTCGGRLLEPVKALEYGDRRT